MMSNTTIDVIREMQWFPEIPGNVRENVGSCSYPLVNITTTGQIHRKGPAVYY